MNDELLLPLPTDNYSPARSDDPGDDPFRYVYSRGDRVEVLARRKGEPDEWVPGVITGEIKTGGPLGNFAIVDIGEAQPVRVKYSDLRPASGKRSKPTANALYLGDDPLVTNDQGDDQSASAVWTDDRTGEQALSDHDEMVRENRRRLGLGGPDPLPLPGEHPFASAWVEGGGNYGDHLRKLATNARYEGDDVLPY
jgi:hypothetical protein